MQKPIIFGPFLGWGHFGVGPLFDPFLDGFWCIAMAIRAFLDVRFSEKAPRVDSNPRATSGVLSGHLVSGGDHYTTPAVAG